MRLAIVQPNLKLRFGLTEADEERCRQFGYDFGRALVKKNRRSINDLLFFVGTR